MGPTFTKSVTEIMQVKDKNKPKSYHMSSDSDSSSGDSAFGGINDDQRKKILEDSDDDDSDDNDKNDLAFETQVKVKAKTAILLKKETLKVTKTSKQAKELLEKQDILSIVA